MLRRLGMCWEGPGQPGAERGVRDTDGGEVIHVYLLLVNLQRRVDEETWDARAGATPDYVRRLAIIPLRCFGEDSRR